MADRGIYIASESTLYRIIKADNLEQLKCQPYKTEGRSSTWTSKGVAYYQKFYVPSSYLPYIQEAKDAYDLEVVDADYLNNELFKITKQAQQNEGTR